MVSWRSLPGVAGFGAELLAHGSAVIDDHLPLAIDAREQVVVLPLDAELADHLAGVVFGELRIVQFLFADFAGVADDVREHAVLRIEAALRLHDKELGEEVAVRIDKGEVGRSQLLLENHGSYLGRERKRMILAISSS